MGPLDGDISFTEYGIILVRSFGSVKDILFKAICTGKDVLTFVLSSFFVYSFGA